MEIPSGSQEAAAARAAAAVEAARAAEAWAEVTWAEVAARSLDLIALAKEAMKGS